MIVSVRETNPRVQFSDTIERIPRPPVNYKVLRLGNNTIFMPRVVERRYQAVDLSAEFRDSENVDNCLTALTVFVGAGMVTFWVVSHWF